MNLNEYQAKAIRTAKMDQTIEEQLKEAALGLAGECGEVADQIKKFAFHGHPLDLNETIKELGDILWYVAFCANTLGYSLDAVAELNIEKLRKRYPQGFDEEKSIHREE